MARKLDINESKIIEDRLRSVEHFLFWGFLTFTSFYFLRFFKNLIIVLIFIFLITFFYTLSLLSFGKIGGYVGEDVGIVLTKFYRKHEIGVKRTLKFLKIAIPASLMFVGIMFLIFSVPDTIIGNRIFSAITAVLGSAVSVILTYFVMKKKRR